MRGVPAKPPEPPVPDAKRAGDDRPWSVADLAGAITGALKNGLPERLRVVGEVSGLRDRTHLYFDLRDDAAAVGCVLFASARKRLDSSALRDGAEVLCEGRIDFWAKGGKVSLIVDRVTPVGAGAAAARLREFVERARSAGWLDDARKRKLPVFPRRIAVITSRSGAALQDVLDTARRRCPSVGVLVIDARVQGEAAIGEVRESIRDLGASAEVLGVDALLVTRGGGSAEDLAAFNDWSIAEAVVGCPVPVVAAIGHETDTTLIELVADRRAATPTQAAVMLTPDRGALLEQLDLTATRLRDLVRGRLQHRRADLRATAHMITGDPLRIVDARRSAVDGLAHRNERAHRGELRTRRRQLDAVATRLEQHRPTAALADRERRLARATEALTGAVRRRLRRERVEFLAGELARALPAHLARLRTHTDAIARELDVVGPAAVLGRGYSITTDRSGRVVRSIEDVRLGGGITTRLIDGTFDAQVLGDPTGEQLDLFGDRG